MQIIARPPFLFRAAGRLIFEGLVDLDPVTLEVIPALAESWDISNNSLTYTFHLIKGVQFHNGREVTSADFRFNFERCLTPENRSEFSWGLTPIRGAKAMLAGEVDTLEGIETLVAVARTIERALCR